MKTKFYVQLKRNIKKMKNGSMNGKMNTRKGKKCAK